MNLQRYIREVRWIATAVEPRSQAGTLARAVAFHWHNWRRSAPDRTRQAIPIRLRSMTERDVHLRDRAGDLAVLFEVFVDEAYAVPASALDPADTHVIVDCGGHIGLTSLWLADRYRNATVIAVEPDAENYALLVANTAGHPRIQTLNACIGPAERTVHLGTGGHTYHSHVADDGVPVAMITLDTLRTRFGFDRIDYLKVDIEGGEVTLFGAPLGKVNVVVAELHGSYDEAAFAIDMEPRKISRSSSPDTYMAHT